MARFLVDGDMPRSTAVALREAGHDVEDVRDVGLRGRSDDDVFAYAQAGDALLVSAAKDFADRLRFRPGTHAGVIVVRVPNVLPTHRVNEALLRALSDLEEESLRGLLIIVEVSRTRIRRPPGSTT